MKKINFNDIIDKCRMRVNGLISYEELMSFLQNNLSVKSYMNMIDKNVIIRKIIMLSNIEKTDNIDEVDLACNLQYSLLFNGLFSYTGLDINREQKTIENYDVIYNSGLADFILSHCQKDYDRFVSIFKEAVGFNDVFLIKTMLSSFDNEKANESLKEIKNFAEDKEAMENLLNIMSFNDPSLKGLRDQLLKIEKEHKKKE